MRPTAVAIEKKNSNQPKETKQKGNISNFRGTPTNMIVSTQGAVLTITVDLTKEFGLTSTGKGIKIASSGGVLPVEGFTGMNISLNIYKTVKQD